MILQNENKNSLTKLNPSEENNFLSNCRILHLKLRDVSSYSKFLIWSLNFSKISVVSSSSSPSSGTIDGNFKQRDVSNHMYMVRFDIMICSSTNTWLIYCSNVTKSRFCNRLTLDSFLKLLPIPYLFSVYKLTVQDWNDFPGIHVLEILMV